MINKKGWSPYGNLSCFSRGRSRKRGQVGDSVVTMYRVLAVIIVSVVILGVSSIVYSHHINIRDSEGMIMVREISGCVLGGGVVDLAKLRTEENIFEYCGFSEDEVERFFVSVSVVVDEIEVYEIEGGDSGLLWVKDVYRSGADVDAIDRYRPGYSKRIYMVSVLDDGSEKDGKVFVEVVVNAE